MIDQKQLEIVEYLNYLDSKTRNDARCIREIKSSIATAKQHSTGVKKNSFRQQIGLKFWEETVKVLHLEHSIVWC